MIFVAITKRSASKFAAYIQPVGEGDAAGTRRCGSVLQAQVAERFLREWHSLNRSIWLNCEVGDGFSSNPSAQFISQRTSIRPLFSARKNFPSRNP